MAHHTLLSGLFQTEDYARTLMEAYLRTTEDEVKERLAGRMERQRILRKDKPPRVIALVDEQALDRNVGGPAVMAERVSRLAEIARLPHVTIQLITGDWPHIGLTAAFPIADTPEPPTMVYLDSVLDGTVVQEDETAEAMIALFDSLRTEAHSGSASL